MFTKLKLRDENEVKHNWEMIKKEKINLYCLVFQKPYHNFQSIQSTEKVST